MVGSCPIWYNIDILILPLKGEWFLESIEIARRAVEASSDKLATDIALLDVREVCSFASYFVICSGDNERQLQAIGDEIEHVLKKDGVRVSHREGTPDSGWLLYDFGDIIVHIFAPVEREFYQFDELWRKAVPIVRIQ
jgi:ribosome-associated protein